MFSQQVFLQGLGLGASLATSHRPAFTAGARAASLLWFTGLGLAVRLGAGVLGKPAVWRGIEAFTGVTMLVLAGFYCPINACHRVCSAG